MAMSEKSKVYVDAVACDGTAAIRIEHESGLRELGYARGAVDGAPVPPGMSLVHLAANEDADGGREVLARYDSKPAKVTSNAYRKGWDAVFGRESIN